MMTDNEWNALTRYITGECSLDEREAMRRWLAEDAARSRLAFEMELINRASLLSQSEWDPKDGWQRLLVRAQHVRIEPSPRRHRTAWVLVPRSAPRNRLALWAVAAAVVFAVAIANQLRARASSARAPGQSTARVFSTRRAQVARVELGDGTVVSLAPESRLAVPADYGAASRAVTLEGEAYFRVVHDSLRPFVVRAGRGVVHDLGTTFLVSSYPIDTATRVVVAEGRVRVRPADAPEASGAVLERGDLARIGRSGVPVIQHGVAVGPYLGWTRGQLIFYRAPLPEALEQLGRWYDVRFILQDSSLRARHLTMSLRTTSADAVAEAMGLALGLRVERRGDTITLRPDARAIVRGRRP